MVVAKECNERTVVGGLEEVEAERLKEKKTDL
jgi:hypothetical protein